MAVMVLTPGAAADVWKAVPHTGLSSLRYAERVVEGRRLLAYDPEGDGRIVEVFGDLDDADHIAVVVPGAGHGLVNYFDDPTGKGPRRSGVALWRELRRRAQGEKTAVIVWIGYDTPERVDLAAVRSDRAIAGAPDLVRLTRTLPEKARVTLVCHSYGGVVCGHAVPDTAVDALVLLGSPGVDVDHVEDLRTQARVWAARAPDDPIRFVPDLRLAGLGHGVDPTSAAFGADTFLTGDIHGHDRYFDEGSRCLANVAHIVLGQESEVTRA